MVPVLLEVPYMEMFLYGNVWLCSVVLAIQVLLSSSEGAILCAAVNRKGGAKGNTALHVAAGKGHLDAVKVLLRSNVEIDKKGRGGMTAVHMAAQAGHAQ